MEHFLVLVVVKFIKTKQGIMMQHTRFARTSNPNPVTSDLDWPEFGATGALLVWDQPISTGAPMDEELCPLLGWETTP